MPRSAPWIGSKIADSAKERLSRRRFGQLLAATGVSLVTAGVAWRKPAAAGNEAFYYTWGGYDIPEFFGEYFAKYNAYPEMASYSSMTEALAKIRGGFVVDVVHPCNVNVAGWIDAGVLQPIDTSKLSHWDDVIPSLKGIGVANGRNYFAAMDWGQNSITYRTDLVDWQGAEESWGLLWDERYKGKIGILSNEGDAWWCAAIYAGVPLAEIGTPENIEKVAELLRRQQPLVLNYYDDVTNIEQALASGELVAAMTWNETPTRLKKEGVPVAFARPKEGALTWVCGAAISAQAPHIDKAHEVIDSLISPESGRFLIDAYGYGHSNAKSFDLVSEERLSELGLTRDPNELLESGKLQTEQSPEFASTIAAIFSEIKSGF